MDSGSLARRVATVPRRTREQSRQRSVGKDRTHVRILRDVHLPDPLTPEALEQVRRSVTMLARGQPSGLDREAALALLEELQRREHAGRRRAELVAALRTLLAAAED